MKKTQGFGVVGAIIVFTVIAVVAIVAWRIYDSNTNTNGTATQNQNGNNANQSGTTPQPDSAKYLDLKELGVKIKLDDKTASLTYLHDTPADGRADGAWIIDPTMKSLDDTNVSCAGPTAGKIGRIDKSNDQHYWSEAALVVDNKTSFKIGEFYYVFRPLQAECSQDTNIAQQRTTKAENFKAVLNSIQTN